MAENNTANMFQDSCYSYGDHMTKNNHDFEKCTTSSHSYSSFQDSTSSNRSSLCDIADDASSSGSFSTSSNSNGSLYDLSDIMAHLPIKKGLSKFYQGKSESFTSLSTVASMEDLAKKIAVPYRKQLKAFKNHGHGLDRYKPYSKSVLTKKVAK